MKETKSDKALWLSFQLCAFATRHNVISPWDGRIFITCTGWALSRRRDRLSEGCLSHAVLDINMWKISLFSLSAKSIQRHLASEQCCNTTANVFHPASIHSCVLQQKRAGDTDVLLTAISLMLPCTQCHPFFTPKTTFYQDLRLTVWRYLLGGHNGAAWVFGPKVKKLAQNFPYFSSSWHHLVSGFVPG